MHKYIPLLLGLLLLLLAACQSNKDKTQSNETDQDTKKVTISDVERGIRSNIEMRTKEGGGYFNFQSDSVNLSLKLVRVHTEYLSVLGPDSFFACVDLATENGDVYDVDFFMKGTPGNMQVTKTDVHKLNGKPYYTWKKGKDKTWYTVPVKNASNDLLGVIEGTDHFNFTYEVQLPELSGPANMWIPIAQSDHFQKIEILSLQAPGKQNMIQEDEYGNTILHLQLLPEHSSQKITMSYRVKREEKAAYREQDADLLKYLEASSLIPVGGRFSTIAEEIIRKKFANSQLTKARALYDYIIDNMRYAKEGVYGTGDANYACD
ncbi:MAG: transglutaminase domain-containing protein, partial [Cyclobacteriaceae bacterium]|nr:transglutaminase domain-containing protein [Cyclobacteriaceae bacterium]